jgi:hypothetical protein
MKFLKNLFGKKEIDIFEGGKIIPVEDMNIGERLSTLVEYSLANDIIILAGNQNKINAFKEKSEDVKVVGFAKGYTKHLKNYDLSNGVLIDESVPHEMLEYLALNFDIKIRGGYTRKA